MIREDICCGLRIAQKVPDFEIDTYEPVKRKFGKFKLSANMRKKKWTVLVFYPADFTFICPTELADVAERYRDIRKAGAEVVSVSTDTHFVHMAWQRDERLLQDVKYPMGADPTGKISRMFGVYDKETGLAFRGTFIINPDGVMVGSEVNFYNVGRNADELVRKLEGFVHVYAHPAEVCPAKWEKGGKTLKPGENLVGKVYEALG
ncbi:alkyl hydroperoxide reductase subunit C [bacterium BMS3Abin07]|nr:alkyl hydroperoxide reductase subunit C [bacterium BMS3Abin07]GBE33426.1 alkyl hydroperoxide reductase subunit C [bacterium BMS3Bbin05]HDL21052.1 redoxin domain-containing protein [Nitrospirota bacterium]HDO21252.1 redoxin domain-containing protein [Nitrospirota bacterium]HDZ87843.1 redoxin domain-containing protein [Nitrospirota bacterium]